MRLTVRMAWSRLLAVLAVSRMDRLGVFLALRTTFL
jgi:hypothetical protein